MTTVPEALLAVLLFSLVIFATRVFPFLLFSRREPPKLLQFIEQSIPPAVMAILVVYSIKDVAWSGLGALPHAVALFTAVALHAWKKNALLSIFGSTALFMVLRLMV